MRYVKSLLLSRLAYTRIQITIARSEGDTSEVRSLQAVAAEIEWALEKLYGRSWSKN